MSASTRRPLAWALALAAGVAAIGLAFVFLDAPIAHLLWRSSHRLKPLGDAFAALVLLSGELVVLASLGVVRLVRGRLPAAAATLALACVASIAAYLVNDLVLKVAFGVPAVQEFIRGAGHGIHAWAGSPASSFPSGHMALASGFAGVVMRRSPPLRWTMAWLLLAGAALLLVGDWHFLSDILAGSLLGLCLGWIAGRPQA